MLQNKKRGSIIFKNNQTYERELVYRITYAMSLIKHGAKIIKNLQNHAMNHYTCILYELESHWVSINCFDVTFVGIKAIKNFH